jgi:hypothetical protein
VYYLNFLAGSSRALAVTEDSNHVWIRSTWKDTDLSANQGQFTIMEFESAEPGSGKALLTSRAARARSATPTGQSPIRPMASPAISTIP